MEAVLNIAGWMVANAPLTVGMSPEGLIERAWGDAGLQSFLIVRTMFTVAAHGVDSTRWNVAKG